jgi:enterobactin synthetase component D
VAHRQFDFRAGRFCARRAVQAVAPLLADAPLGRRRGGAVAWPSGITGSITHTHDFVSAAVAASCHASAIGIDCERILVGDRARHVARVVAWPVEVKAWRDAGLDRLTALTLVFSAKESIFKCVYAQVGRVFGFHDIRIISVDAATQRFCARVTSALSSSLTPGTELTGQYEVEDGRVHTGLFLPPTAPASSRP